MDWIDRIDHDPVAFDGMAVDEADPEDDAEVVVLGDPAATDVVDEFVGFFNARDLDGIGDLLSDDVEAEMVRAVGASGAVEGLEDLFIREPLVMLTRASGEDGPIAVLWHPSDSGLAQVGFLEFEFDDGDPPAVTRIEYVDEMVPEDVMVEPPDELDVEDWEIAAEMDDQQT
jgi:hypothetical protein